MGDAAVTHVFGGNWVRDWAEVVFGILGLLANWMTLIVTSFL